MKRKAYCFLSIAMLFALTFSLSNCKKDDGKDDTPVLKLGSETLTFPKEGGSSVVVVEANSEWSVEIPSDATWIAASPLSSTKKNAIITFTLLPNTGLARQADVKVKTATLSETINIQQAGIVKTYINVAQLRSKGETTITDDLYLKASLINDQAGGNSTSLKNIIVADSTAGICVRLVADASAMAVGTELEFKLQGAALSKYNGLLQLNNYANTDMTPTGRTVVIPAKTITVSQLKSGVYESMYIAIDNVQVVNADLSKTMVVGTSHTSINMEPPANENFVMFNASYSEFKSLPVPQGSGTLKGIASVNNSVFQVQPQNRNDFAGLTGTRFGNAPQLTFGTPALSGTFKKGVALTSENIITIPYTLATAGQSYNLSVAVSGTGAAGIASPATASGSFAAASGNIVVLLTGTPTSSGSLSFSITGTGISTPIVVEGVVSDPESSKTMATWTFDSAPAGFPIASSTISTDESTNGSLTLSGFATPLPTIGYTSSSKTIYVNTWDLGKSWLFSFTPKQPIASGKTLSVTFKGYGSNTAPKDMVVEYSKDGSTWTQLGAAIEYAAAIATYTRTVVLTESLSGQVQIRIKVNSTVSISGATIASGGNSRLADVVISVN
jgi:hypothetical protein